MSNFYCEKCGTAIYDTEYGYVTGCKHYPVEDLNKVCKSCKYNIYPQCLIGNDYIRHKLASDYYKGCKDYAER